ncbi:MAG: hypothetical protein KDN05_19925 [Verrucomicrobiae bacterium]|nr:hypothetical protein [Verrucomicrobiae bacterium]
MAQTPVRHETLRVSTEGLSALRTSLTDPTAGMREEAVAELAKSRKIELLASFREEDPWVGRPVHLEKAMGELEKGGEVMKCGVKLEIEGSGEQPEFRYGIEATLPAGGKKARYFQMLGTSRKARAAGWVERCCWSDGKEAVMLWEYATAGAKEEPQTRPAVHVEMRWFQAADADVAKLGASKPGTRGKALQWIESRAKLCREAGYDLQCGQPAVWTMTEGRFDPAGGGSISDDGLMVETKGVEERGRLKMEWKMTAMKGGEPDTSSLHADLESGVWEFLPVKDNPEANVLACRVTKL